MIRNPDMLQFTSLHSWAIRYICICVPFLQRLRFNCAVRFAGIVYCCRFGNSSGTSSTAWSRTLDTQANHLPNYSTEYLQDTRKRNDLPMQAAVLSLGGATSKTAPRGTFKALFDSADEAGWHSAWTATAYEYFSSSP